MSAVTEDAAELRPAQADEMPDPFVLAVDGVWYAYATSPGPSSQGEPRVLRLLVSEDFKTWRRCPNPLIAPAGAAGCSFWAPEVAQGDDGRFYLYYSFGREADQQHRLRVAVADRFRSAAAPSRSCVGTR